MATFSRPRESQPIDRGARIQTMMDMPFTVQRNLGEQFRQGALDSFGLGTVLRQAQIPRGNTAPDMGGPIPNPVASLGRLAQNVGDMIRGNDAQPSMSQDEYKASPYFRTEIPFQEGMTQDRAAALALFYDTKKTREYFGSKRPFSTFIGQFGGQAFDPINYVPVFGQAATSAAVARFGTVAGRALVGAGDAAINTAAFGLLTSGLRDQFGDDTSFQAMTSEIAMSALIGGVFGGVAPLVRSAWSKATGRPDRAAEARIANKLTDIRAVKESRAILNETVGDLVAGRDVTVSPNAAAVVDRITSAVTAEGTATRALREQTANVSGDAVAITPSGARVNVRPEVVDASSLIRASGDLQVRNRSSQASASQVEEIAVNLDPMRLMPSIDADSGAPIVGGDGIVDSGNGRVMAINRAYEAYPERAAAYRKALEDAGYDLTGIDRPVLINRRTTELSREARAKFNAEANAPRAAQMNAVELAAMDRNALEGTLDVLDASPITSAANRPFVQRFIGNLSPSARGALVDANGALNADGARRIENALVAAAYGDVDLNVVKRFAEATDDNTRAIVGAMSDVAGRWALMRNEVKLGNISPEFDVTEELTQALRLIGQWRDQATREKRPVSVVIKEGMGQLDLLDGEISPEAQVMVSAFYRTNSFAQAAGRETIADFLGKVVDAAIELGRPSLFDNADFGKLELLRNVAVNEQANLFTSNGAVDGVEADGGFSRRLEDGADRQGSGQGTVEGRSVAERLTERFTAAGRPEPEARATAEIVDAFYAQQASRLGLTMDEMVERFGLPEVRRGDAMPEAAMGQAARSEPLRDFLANSKVKKVVYHATSASFDAFDTTLGDLGAHFGTVDQANKAAERGRGAQNRPDGEGASVMPVYINVENPLRLKDEGSFHGWSIASQLARKGIISKAEAKRIEAEGWREQKKNNAIVRDAIKAAGYDSVVYKNTTEGAGDSYIAFDPTQIKAQFNRGTFDPNDPRILNQPAYHGTPHLFDKFSTDKIGTGEGAQAYGYGLYFSSSKKVSEWYRDTLTRRQAGAAIEVGGNRYASLYEAEKAGAFTEDEWLTIEAYDFPDMVESVGLKRAIVVLREMVEGDEDAGALAAVESAIAKIVDVPVGKGRLFEVDVPDDVEMLDWNKPITEQPALPADAIEALINQHGGEMTKLRSAGGWLRPTVTGQMLYNALEKTLGSDRAASDALRAAGIPGHRYIGNESGVANYVVYDDSRVTVRSFEQGGANPRGAIQLGDTDVITLFETADASTALHETGHLFLSMLKGMGEKGDAPDAIKADWESTKDWWRTNAAAVAADANASGRAKGVTAKNVLDALDLGTTGDAAKDRAIDVGMQEQWARGFEAYVREGNAPSAGLARAFEQFREWLTAIYRRAADLKVDLSPEIRQVFDNLLAAPADRAAPSERATPSIDGMPIRLGEPPASGRASPVVARMQASILDNEPANAAARVGKDDSIREIALAHGVDPSTGAFIEQGDLAQLQAEGRMTSDDIADMAAADQMFADADAYGRALDAAVRCIL